jgi:hypothetical protein
VQKPKEIIMNDDRFSCKEKKRKTGYNLKLKMGARIGNWSQLKGRVAGGES